MSRLLVGGMALLMSGLISSAALAAPIVTLSGPTTVAANSTLSLVLAVAGLDEEGPDSVGAWDLTLNFDPARLTGSSVVFGDPILGDQLDPTDVLPPLSTSAFDGVGGTLSLGQTSLVSISTLDDNQQGAFILAEILFTVGETTGPTTLDLCVPGGVQTCLLGDASANALSFSTSPGAGLTILVEVPEPSAWLMIALSAPLASRRVARAALRTAR